MACVGYIALREERRFLEIPPLGGQKGDSHEKRILRRRSRERKLVILYSGLTNGFILKVQMRKFTFFLVAGIPLLVLVRTISQKKSSPYDYQVIKGTFFCCGRENL